MRFRLSVVVGLTIGAAALATALALPALAGATTYCVPSFHAACPNNGTNVAQASVETAMQSNATDGIADAVIIEAGHTYTDTGSLLATGSDGLTVIGGGPTTVLTSSSAGNIFVVDLNAGNSRDIKLQDLTIVIPASFPDGLGSGVQVAGDTLQDVDVISENPGSDGLPSWVGAGTFVGGTVRGQGAGSIGDAFRIGPSATSPVAIRDATVKGAANGITVSGSQPVVNVTRSAIQTSATVGQAAVASNGGMINVTDSVLETPKGLPLYEFVNSATPATINVDGTTMVNQDAVSKAALNAQVGGAGTANATINVESSIATGFTNGYSSQSTGAGAANITLGYSNISATGVDTGPGTVTRTNSIEAHPLFTSATDYHLQASSPSVDAGDPASALVLDLDGNVRPNDGDGNGTAVVDQGAFERPTPAAPTPTPDPTPAVDTVMPQTTITSGPGKRAKKGKPKFAFAADEVASFECKLNNSTWTSCSSPQQYKLKRKRKAKSYGFSVRATDTAGNVDDSPASKRFQVKGKRPKRR